MRTTVTGESNTIWIVTATRSIAREFSDRGNGSDGTTKIETMADSHLHSRPTLPAPTRVPEPHAAGESELVAAVLRKDRKATADFVARYADPVYAYVRQRLVPRTDLVDDLVQEVFLAALQGLNGFAGRAGLRGWLLGIARHKVEDHYRARLRSPERPFWLEDESGPALAEFPRFDERMDRVKLEEKTRRILARLPEPYGLALLWRYWERRSAKEMAAQTGRSEKAIERLLARARAHFKRLWEAD